MKRMAIAALVAAFAVGTALAQAPAPAPTGDTCEAKALSKDGKPLSGAAKTKSIAKCKRDECTPKAVSAEGKPLAGAAKKSFMTKCMKETT
jgi:hypothetical protein